MQRHFCKSCRRLQAVTDDTIEFIDHGQERYMVWWRCQRCDQLSFITYKAEPLDLGFSHHLALTA